MSWSRLLRLLCTGSAMVCALLCCTPWIHAHPVAQGALEVRIAPGEIAIRARVSAEEVFVASTFSSAPRGDPSLSEVWKAHGEYLLKHFQLFADGQPLAGLFIAHAAPPAGSPSTAPAVYDFAFSLPPDAALPREIRLEENVLQEFSYAPGNPWTASYVVRIDQPGRAAPIDGLLLDRHQPLEFRCATAPAAQPAGSALEIGQWRLWKEYIVHGLFHILTGYDHLLFMAALVLGAKEFWDLVKVVSAFTLAHTVTLTLSVLDVVRLSSQIVEPMIAASIIFVALQNVIAPASTRGWTRLAIAFFFGLFHGLGFAGGLLHAMAGLPTLAIAAALAAFSIGVELGHQVVDLPIFGALQLVVSNRDPERGVRRRQLAERYCSALITLAGGWYLCAALGGMEAS